MFTIIDHSGTNGIRTLNTFIGAAKAAQTISKANRAEVEVREDGDTLLTFDGGRISAGWEAPIRAFRAANRKAPTMRRARNVQKALAPA